MASKQEYSKVNMHKFFRLFDDSNDHLVSPSEFQESLQFMGYPHTDNPAITALMFEEIDQLQTGYISEGAGAQLPRCGHETLLRNARRPTTCRARRAHHTHHRPSDNPLWHTGSGVRRLFRGVHVR